MKQVFLSALFLTLSASIHAQIGVGNETPKATLDVVGKPSVTTVPDGLIAPRITRAELIAKTAYGTNQTGTILYVTDLSGSTNTATSEVLAVGYYYFDGTKWISFSTSDVKTANYAWNISNAYVQGTIVTHNNLLYQANDIIVANTAFAVGTSGATWREISPAVQEWSDTTAYTANALVSYGDLLYVANAAIAANTGFTVGLFGSGATWRQAGIGQWREGSVYAAGAAVYHDNTIYFANAAIPANTPFSIGTTGATWTSITGTAEYGEELLPSNVVLNDNNVFTILTANIPSAGTWEIEYSLNVYYSGAGSSDAANFWIANSSDVAVVGSGIGAYTTDQTNSSIVATRKITVTTQEATTFTVQGRRATQLGPMGTNLVTVYGGGGGNTVSNGGASKVSWKKIAGFLPIEIPRVSDQSQSNYIDIGEVRYQWGESLSGNTGQRTITFPAAFKNTTYSFVGTVSGVDDVASRTIYTSNPTTTNIKAKVTAGGNGSGAAFQWMAIGLKP